MLLWQHPLVTMQGDYTSDMIYCKPEMQPKCLATRRVIAITTEMGKFIIHGVLLW